MYSRISIKNFRGIKSLEAERFRRINLIVGRNNSGKTTFLEGLFLLGDATNPLSPTTLGRLRGQRLRGGYPDAIWRPLFHNLDAAVPVQISGLWEKEPRERTLKIQALETSIAADLAQLASGDEGGAATATPDLVTTRLVLDYKGAGNVVQPATMAVFDPRSGKIDVAGHQYRDDFVRTGLLSARAYPDSARDAQQFSSLRKKKHDKDVIDALQIIEPSVQRIEVLSEPSGPSIYLDIGLDALVPLAVCGEGMVRQFSIILELIASRNGVLLIDEIDNGLHYTVMPTLWKFLGELAEKHKVQVFGTTHNDDIIRSALEVFAGKEGMLGLFRIDKRGDRHAMVAYDEEAMEAVRVVPFEVRG
jgi:AAA domain, putative AbiEii toxin, Type IV TA system/AAA ATPase domain